MTCTIYIDFKRDCNQDIIEIAAVCVSQRKIVATFHHFIDRNFFNSYDYKLTASYCHCIPESVLKNEGASENMVRHLFVNWIESLNFEFITIKGHGEDTSRESIEKWVDIQSFSNLSHLEYEQVYLPHWNQRRFALYHMSAFVMKEHHAIDKLCSKSNHSLKYRQSLKRRYNTPTHNQLARQQYGFHCALIDCFEMAFYENALPTYCCDDHFIDLFDSSMNNPDDDDEYAYNDIDMIDLMESQ